MKPLRNILLLLSYIFGIASIAIISLTQSEIYWFSVLALILVLIAFFMVKTERRHARIPMAISLIGLVLAFAIPYLFPPKIDVQAEEDFQEYVEEANQEEIKELENILEEEPTNSVNPNGSQNEPTSPKATENRMVDSDSLQSQQNIPSEEIPEGLDAGEDLAPLDFE